ncbi:MAG: AAA family ATPase [Sphingobium sp.]
MDHFVIISGCSGGGKSSLLAELARRGYATVSEPGRRIVTEERAAGGNALPWINLAAFARRAIAMAVADRDAMRDRQGWVFFDRGLIDAAAALERATARPALAGLSAQHRYHSRVFLTPPWPDIYVADRDRPHDFGAAAAEYAQLRHAYVALDYTIDLLPRISVARRADYILDRLGRQPFRGQSVNSL